MPWDIRRNYGGCKGYAVVKESGEVVACHKTRASAVAQQRALYASEQTDKGNGIWRGAIVPNKKPKLSE